MKFSTLKKSCFSRFFKYFLKPLWLMLCLQGSHVGVRELLRDHVFHIRNLGAGSSIYRKHKQQQVCLRDIFRERCRLFICLKCPPPEASVLTVASLLHFKAKATGGRISLHYTNVLHGASILNVRVFLKIRVLPYPLTMAPKCRSLTSQNQSAGQQTIILFTYSMDYRKLLIF